MQRKFLLLLMMFFAFVSSFNCQSKKPDEKADPCKFLSSARAEKILGQKVELIISSRSLANGKTKFECAYRAVEKDETSGREINLFFTREESASVEGSKKIYETIWESNKNHAGIEILDGIGDEAYFHSDKPNFHFVMLRKGIITIRLKINKAVESTSPEELRAFAKQVSEQI